ncbi:MAG: lipopolysaccharide transport system permease protein, partial [Actinomycetota bacterium]|nr:lipopolysaccharide transport system permease protein [Actinomycetota bacterium]
MSATIADDTEIQGEQGRLPMSHWVAITWMLALRTFRLRYLRSRLGVGWALIQPVIQTVVLAFMFTRIFKVAGVPHYPLYVLSGVMTWQAFQTSVASSTTSAVENSALLKKVDMPGLVFPLSQVLAVMLVYGVQLIVLVILAAVSGTLGLKVFLLIPVALLVAASAAGLGCLTCAFHVAYRDVKFLVDAGLLLTFYATPILYDPARVPEHLRHLLALNPMYGVESLARAAVLDRPVDIGSLWLGGATT